MIEYETAHELQDGLYMADENRDALTSLNRLHAKMFSKNQKNY